MRRKLREVEVVEDDESNLTLSHSNINENDGFYTSDVIKTHASEKFKTAAKFKPIVLVYVCAASRGISKAIIAKSGTAIKQET